MINYKREKKKENKIKNKKEKTIILKLFYWH